MDDHELLQDYIERRSETAFAELVSRHVNLVYSTAVRVVRDGPLAEDVAQTVFIALARKPRAIRDARALAGWLYRSTQLAAAQVVRTEQRRQAREHEAMKRVELESEGTASWAAVGPLLEEGMSQLNRADQDAVVLRYFEGRSLRETGAVLALSEDVAQKRVTRALEKLRRYFARRGVVATAALLAEALGANAVQAAPSGLAASLSSAALAGSAGTAGMAGKIFVMGTEYKVMAAVMAAALVVTPVILQQWQIGRLHEALAATNAANTELMADVVGPDGLTSAQRKAKAVQPKPTLAEIRAFIETDAHKKDSEWHDWDLREYAQDIPPSLLPQAMGFVEEAATGARRDGMREELLSVWAQHNPVGAMMYAGRLDGLDPRQQAELTVVAEWVNVDATAAAAWVRQLPAGDFRAHAAGEMLHGLDPPTAWALYQDLGGDVQYGGRNKSVTDPFQPTDACNDIFSRWVLTDAATATALAAQLPADHRSQADAGIAKSWSQAQPAAAMAWAAGLPEGDDKNAAVKTILDAWSQKDMAGAAQAAFSLPDGDVRAVAISTLINNWANTDMKAAVAWLGQLPDGADKQSAQAGLALQWVNADPVAAMAYAQAMPAGDATDQLIRKMAEAWMDYDPFAVADWVQNAPPGAARDAVLVEVAQSQVASPELAQLVMTLPADERKEAIFQLAAGWAQMDSVAAANWVASLPAGSLDDDEMETLARDFARSDLAAAGQWAQALPPGTSRDHALNSYVRELAQESADTAAQAAQLTEGIGDPKLRDQAQASVARRWLARDPASAAAWLATTNLPDSTRQKLLSLP